MAPTTSRSVIFISTGIVLPKINYSNYPEEAILLYFIKNNKVVSLPVPLWHENFIFSQNLNYFNFLMLKKEEAVFTFEKFENDYFDLFTLKSKNNP